MDVLLISGRGLGAKAHPSRVQARALVDSLRARGDTVRWLCPVEADEAAVTGSASTADGARYCQAIPSTAPGFRAVQGRLSDLGSELSLTRELRRSPPDLVHQLACGGATSEALSWIAQRLGVPCVMSLELAETLCHRGTLVDERGRTCDDWDDPLRCRACCSAAGPDSLTAGQALAAKVLRPLGGLSPFPSRTDFQNRVDMLVAALMAADRVWVRDDLAREQLVRTGVPKRSVVVVGEPDELATLRMYDELLA